MKLKLFSLFCIVLLLFTSCRKHESGGKVIEFWTLQLSPFFDTYFKDAISAYEKSHPGITIKYVDIPYDAAIQKLMAAVSAEMPPDIINLSADFLAKFEGLKLLTDLSQFESADSLNARFLENAMAECTYGSRIAALPWYLNTYILIYNKELMQKAGFDSTDIPQTFDQFTAFIREYKARTGKFATFWNIGKDSYLPMMLGSEGIVMTDSNMQRALFNNPESFSKINAWVQLVKEKYLSVDCVIKPGSAIIEPYQSGQVAMVFTGSVFLKRVKDNAPGIYAATAIAPPITGKTGKHELAAMALSILESSSNKVESYEFLKYILNAENQLRFSKMAPVFPSDKKALQDAYFTKEDSSLEAAARVMGTKCLPSATRLRHYLRHPKFDRLRNLFDEAIQTACLTKTPLQTALDKATRSWNVILDEK